MDFIIEELLNKKQEFLLKINHIDEVLSIYGYKYEDDFPTIDLSKKNNQKSIEDQYILETTMSLRLCNLLIYSGCIHVKDILAFSKADLLKRRGFGKGMISELEKFLKNNNLKLKRS